MSHRLPRHQAVHDIATEFVRVLWQALHNHEAFDNDAYRQKLDKLLPRSRRGPT